MSETPEVPAENEDVLSPAEEAAIVQEQQNIDQAILQSQLAYLTNRLTALARENAVLKEQLAATNDASPS